MSTEAVVSRDEVVMMLSKALGTEASVVLVDDGMRVTGCSGNHMTVSQAARLLQWLADQGGIVAAVASFAKARLLLRGTRQP